MLLRELLQNINKTMELQLNLTFARSFALGDMRSIAIVNKLDHEWMKNVTK